MDYRVCAIGDVLKSLIGKSICVSCEETKVCGKLVQVRNNGYYYELVMNPRKKLVLFFPFNFYYDEELVEFDYRLSTLAKRIPKELAYNLKETPSHHPFLGKVVKITQGHQNEV